MGERRRRASAVAGGDGRGEEKAAAPAPAPAPTVWFALKKSLQCRSQSSEVHVPKPKASSSSSAGGHLSSIMTKRAARSGCSRSIANLRDVIHGSKRHPGQPPSCSPRSIGSSEFLNPIAHEVVLSTNSRCELKITGFGGCGGLGAAGGGAPAHEAEGGGDGGVVSSFVGTLRPGTPGPGWSHGLQYSGSCRAGSMRCTPPRSPNPLLDRDGAPAATAHRASCEVDAAKTGGAKGSGGLSCHRCAEQFGKWEALEAHHLSKHAGEDDICAALLLLVVVVVLVQIDPDTRLVDLQGTGMLLLSFSHFSSRLKTYTAFCNQYTLVDSG
uniref:C2H2-type domain-containing protein n=1 Tax=Aegilops tauschii subsp. strangulata TaxID=200361 RepID=A0A453FPY6_AEGTS